VNAQGASTSFEALIVTTIDDPDIFDLLVERGVNFEKAQDNFGGICGGEEMLIPYCIRYNSGKLLRHLIKKEYWSTPKLLWVAFICHDQIDKIYPDISHKQRLGNFNYLLKTGILNPTTQSEWANNVLDQLPISFRQSCIEHKFNISL
jgi:hypothetical protein